MSEANEPGPDVAVIVNAGEAPEGEGGGGGEMDAASQAAVQIAEIEAGKEIALAEIRNEGEAEFAERISNQELEQCRLRIAELEGENSGLRETVSTLEATVAALTPPPSPEPPPNPPEPPPSPDEADPAPAPAESASPPEEPPKPKRRAIRWT